jgi:glycine C-acetyltransferase/8-amino-7-oxononanoate synthase
MRMESAIGPRMLIDGREVDYFCGTSYFCLHGHPEVIEAACLATRRYGLGPGTLAHMPVYEELQEELAVWFGVEQVTTMISGYASPMALLQGLKDSFDIVFVDRATHYSARDALDTVNKPVLQFGHCDALSLAEAMARHVAPGQRPAVVTDGVFPSTGALAPLKDYRQVMALYEDSVLVVDDSHGVGTLGSSGRGSLQLAGLESDRNYFAGTLSKAFGASGGIIPGGRKLAEAVDGRAMIMRGASRMTPGSAAAAAAALRVLKTRPHMRESLARNVKHLRDGMRALGFEVAGTPVPIVSLRGNVDFDRVRDGLNDRDIVVRVVKASGYSDAPDVPIMRLAVFSEHSPAQLDHLLRTMGEIL